MTVALIGTIKNFVGLSSDTKPVNADIPIGSRFAQADTPSEYIYIGDGYFATQTLVMADKPDATDTILIGATTYTFRDTADFDTAGEIDIGATQATATAAIIAAINGTDGVNSANADVVASADGSDVLITALVYGAAANSLDTVYTASGASANAFGAATMAGGYDAWQVLP